MEIVNSEIILEKSGRAPTTDLLECDFPSGRSLALSQGKEFEPKGVQHQVSEPKRLRDEAKRLRKGWLKACDNWNLAWWKMNQLEQGPMTFASSKGRVRPLRSRNALILETPLTNAEGPNDLCLVAGSFIAFRTHGEIWRNRAEFLAALGCTPYLVLSFYDG